jgi:hypothetical protein
LKTKESHTGFYVPIQVFIGKGPELKLDPTQCALDFSQSDHIPGVHVGTSAVITPSLHEISPVPDVAVKPFGHSTVQF